MRARNIKPGFFQNEDIAELPPETRLLFIGLWMMADREGRLEDRPKKIKMQIFPADTWEVDPMLAELDKSGLIIRYEVDGKQYIEIPKFLQHQRPHHQEKDSVIPERVRTKVRSGSNQGASLSALIPDTGFLNPDSGKKKGAKRAPKDFAISVEMYAWAEDQGLDAITVNAQTDAFKDHEFKTARKDWQAVWRNWMRRHVEWREKNETRGRADSFTDIHARNRKAAGLD